MIEIGPNLLHLIEVIGSCFVPLFIIWLIFHDN
jgi:hypothetical protein